MVVALLLVCLMVVCLRQGAQFVVQTWAMQPEGATIKTTTVKTTNGQTGDQARAPALSAEREKTASQHSHLHSHSYSLPLSWATQAAMVVVRQCMRLGCEKVTLYRDAATLLANAND